jgi:drug/metabolite transporter (DMT)-like permease
MFKGTFAFRPNHLIVFAALIGWRWLDESFGRARILGAMLIFVGILIIAIVG